MVTLEVSERKQLEVEQFGCAHSGNLLEKKQNSPLLCKNEHENYKNQKLSPTQNIVSPFQPVFPESEIIVVPSMICNDTDDDNISFSIIDVDNEDEELNKRNDDLLVTHIPHENANGQALPRLNESHFGDISITHSKNVQVGNTTLYKGPVTIKQFMYTNSTFPTNGDLVADRKSDLNPPDGSTVKGNRCIPIYPIYPENYRVKQWMWTWRCAAILCILGLILVTSIVVISVMFSRNQWLTGLESPRNPDDILTEDIRFINRVEWGAQPPEEPSKKLTILPAPYVIISHTASTPCSTQSECSKRVRVAQTLHIEGNNWSDIGYNFLVGGDGVVYEGRGWDVEGAHTFNWNKKSIGISCIGTFNTLAPSKRQIYALGKLIEVGVKNGKIDKNYKLLGHRQISETLSPGNVLYTIIKSWDHWIENPLD